MTPPPQYPYEPPPHLYSQAPQQVPAKRKSILPVIFVIVAVLVGGDSLLGAMASMKRGVNSSSVYTDHSESDATIKEITEITRVADKDIQQVAEMSPPRTAYANKFRNAVIGIAKNSAEFEKIGSGPGIENLIYDPIVTTEAGRDHAIASMNKLEKSLKKHYRTDHDLKGELRRIVFEFYGQKPTPAERVSNIDAAQDEAITGAFQDARSMVLLSTKAEAGIVFGKKRIIFKTRHDSDRYEQLQESMKRHVETWYLTEDTYPRALKIQMNKDLDMLEHR